MATSHSTAAASPSADDLQEFLRLYTGLSQDAKLEYARRLRAEAARQSGGRHLMRLADCVERDARSTSIPPDRGAA